MGLISLVIINDNGELYLSKLFTSLSANGKFGDIDIVFVDHSSSDASIEIAKSWGVNKIAQINRPSSRSVLYNEGASLSENEYVLFVHSDIYFERAFINKLSNELEVTSVDFASFNQCYVDGAPVDIESVSYDIKIDHLWYKSYLHFFNINMQPTLKYGEACSEACFLIKKSILNDYKFDEEYLMAFFEHDMFLRLYQAGLQFTLYNNSFFHYFIEMHEKLPHFNRDEALFINKNCITVLERNRRILIWGTGELGHLVYKSLAENHIRISGFIDSDKNKIALKVNSTPIYHYDILDSDDMPYVLVASMYYEEIKPILEQKGYEENKDFFDVRIKKINVVT
ncbi:glycosyltransferase [Paenibacillus vini]|uniref:glycosyltransferase n=1 Tax=Paenibacillus vini TaxID=1476024 RepID=UPI0025B69FCC|nr:glycosyltransferase [Paenibacillus vini]MDN4066448.1 glycosyltransferase [Paenibacillus vini]